MKTKQKRRYIITGTPGAGKTTIIHALSRLNYTVIHEAATDIISIEHNLGNLEPWHSSEFIEKIVSLQKKREIDAENSLVDCEFYDRSPICTYALSLYLGFFPSNVLKQEIERIKRENIYEKSVFFIENLGFIENTDARKISFEDSLKFEQIHLKCYAEFGFECIRIPAMSVDSRIEYMNAIIQRLLVTRSSS